jgi:hypothetical protein
MPNSIVRGAPILGALLVLALPALSTRSPARTLGVRIDTQEADASLAIIAAHGRGAEATPAQWERLFTSAGYRRLGERERAFGRQFSDSAFRAFLHADTLVARGPALEGAVAEWKRADLSAAEGRALAYLPPGTAIRATLYPVIKPRGNSFVFDTEGDPAIFLYVDPAVSRAKLENTVAHELHHIGLAAACRAPADGAATEPVRLARRWASGFGEGLAMLAAAGGPDVHPHAVSDSAERARWDADVAHFEPDLRRVERFLLDVASGRLAGDEASRTGMEFFGVQGPWYTVGWRRAATIERAFGRARLISVECDPAALLETYDAAARRMERGGRAPAVWSDSLIAALRRR